MATLRLLLTSTERAAGTIQAPVIARLLQMQGSVPKLVRTVSIRPGQAKTIENISPGDWDVRLIMPDGQTMSQMLEVNENAANELRMRTPSVERHSAASPTREIAPQRFPASAPALKSRRSLGSQLGSLVRGTIFNPDRRFGAKQSSDPDAGPAEALFLAHERNHRATRLSEAWRRWEALLRFLRCELPAKEALPGATWPEHLPLPAGQPVAVPYASTRVYILAKQANGDRLHVVPVPWRRNDEQLNVYLAMGSHADATTHVELQDDLSEAVVRSLARGNLNLAKDLLSSASAESDSGGELIELLQEKVSCPLAAAAAAYVLVGSSATAEPAPWQQWVCNLANMFDWVPDGAILQSRLQLLQGDNGAQQARPMLAEALKRGLPYYTVGLSWLIRGLLYEEDTELARFLPLLREVSRFLDMDEAFTTFDFRMQR